MLKVTLNFGEKRIHSVQTFLLSKCLNRKVCKAVFFVMSGEVTT